MNNDIFFVNREGNKVYNENIASHIGLASLIIKETPELEEEFLKSKMIDPVDFLISKGYLKVSNIGYYRKVVFLSNIISEKQRRLVEYYEKQGYTVDDLYVRRIEKRLKEREEE